MTHRMLISLFFVVAASGCADAHEPEGVAPGLYELTVQTDLDACTPMRPTGSMGPVAVLVEGTTLDVPVPDAEATVLTAQRVRLSPDSSFHAETNRHITGCDGAWVHEEWTVMDTHDEGFDLLVHQDWQGLESCTSAVREPVPAADCSSERTMGYRLRAACYEPCSLQLTGAGEIACSCD